MRDNAFTNIVKRVLAFIKRNAIRAFNYLKVAKMEWIIMIAVFVFDMVSKSLVENFIDYGNTVSIIPYVFNAHRIHNSAAAFGSGWLHDILGNAGARIFYCVFAVAASVAFALILIRNKGKSKVLRIALALFVAGAMGNCIDRMALGYVRDFIEFVYFGMTIGGSETWAYIFNIADVALVTGVFLIIFYFLFLYRDHDKKKLGVDVDVVTEAASVEIDQASEDRAENTEDTEGDDDEAAEAPEADKPEQSADEVTEISETPQAGGDAV